MVEIEIAEEGVQGTRGPGLHRGLSAARGHRDTRRENSPSFKRLEIA